MERWVRAWNEQDDAEIARLFSPEYTVNGVRIGADGVARSVHFLHTVFGDASLSVQDLIIAGDRVVLRWTLCGIHRATFVDIPPTGKEITLHGTNIYHLIDGQIAENWENIDVFGTLRQLGAILTIPETAP